MENHAQLALSFEPRKLARADGPATSKEAARACKELRGRQHEEILRVLLRSEAPLTACEIADYSDGEGALDKHQAGRRLGELVKAGYVEVAGVGTTDTGRSARTYRLRDNFIARGSK